MVVWTITSGWVGGDGDGTKMEDDQNGMGWENRDGRMGMCSSLPVINKGVFRWPLLVP